jgi:excisionase family DNA binding protein
MKEQIILEKLDIIEKLLIGQSLLQKDVLNFNEAAQYLQVSQSYLYKLTSTKNIPHFCPNGKRLYFNRGELDLWVQRNPVTSIKELTKKKGESKND